MDNDQNDLFSFEEEKDTAFFEDFDSNKKDSETINDVLSENSIQKTPFLKFIIIGILTIAVVVLAFWASFSLGKMMFSYKKKHQLSNIYSARSNDNDENILINDNKQKDNVEKEFIISPAKTTEKEKKIHQQESTPATKKVNTQKAPNTKNQYDVIAGSFIKENSAYKFATTLQKRGFKCIISEININNKTMYRVVIGQAKTFQEAQKIKHRAKKLGYDSFVLEK